MKELWRVVPAHIMSLSQTYYHENKGILISLPRSTVLDVIHSAVSLESPPEFVLGSHDDDDAPATLCASGAPAAKKPKKNKKAKPSSPPPFAIDDEDGGDDDASSTSAGPSAAATDTDATDFDLNQPKQKKVQKDKPAKKHKSKKDKFSQE